MGYGMVGRVDHELEKPARLDPRRPPLAIGLGHAPMDRSAEPLTRLGRGAVDLDSGAGERTSAGNAAGKARHQPAERDVGFMRDADLPRLTARDELKNLPKGTRMERDLAMIEIAEHQVGGATQ